MPYSLKDSQVGADTFTFICAGGYDANGSSFVPASSYNITRISVKIAKAFGPVGNVRCAIYSDVAGNPGVLLATSATLVDATTLPNGAGAEDWYDFDFAGQAVVNGTRYHIVLYGDGAGNGFGGATVSWARNSVAVGQSISVRDTGAWFGTANDTQYDFRTYETTSATSAAVTGTGGAGMTSAEVRAGAKTLIVTLTGDTFVAAGAAFNAQRQAIINGIDSATAPTWGWDVIKALIPVASVVRTSATVCTITLPALSGYQSDTTEVLTITVPAAALTLAAAIVAAPTVSIARTVTDLTPVDDYAMEGTATRTRP